jgi:hypothetical protein
MPPSRTFLVEAYAPAESELLTVLEQARRAAAVLDEGQIVLHVRSILVAEDETCFHLYQADSLETVSAAISAAEIHATRIVEVAS